MTDQTVAEYDAALAQPDNAVPKGEDVPSRRSLPILMTFHTNRLRKTAFGQAVLDLKSAGWDQAGVQGILNLWVERGGLEAFTRELLDEIERGNLEELKRQVAGEPAEE